MYIVTLLSVEKALVISSPMGLRSTSTHTQGVVTQKGLMTVPRGDIAPLLAHMIASLMHIREASLSSSFITGPCACEKHLVNICERVAPAEN
jgi:hypothetical protein